MRMPASQSWIALLIGALLAAAPALAAERIAVIANPALEDTLSREEIARLFLGRNGSYRVYDLPDRSPLKARFYEKLLGKTLAQVNAERARLAFSGRGTPPEELISAKAVKSAVASDPRAIGYIDGREVDETVKVLLWLE